ncbi:hypothetical protein DVR12_22570 [Chitinophaga silvatica]|uniref:Mannosyltransferase (PIG-V) n=1 Tax=Chitinophaga silvatica TaxID=2282649 RepID=A0A3E1Y463_9BACT|nr:hypothetical protein [Chitinophaga silvatica]RFS19422.1 hypothetical protein DVR12_22570 [Chitinophaga silvatica]
MYSLLYRIQQQLSKEVVFLTIIMSITAGLLLYIAMVHFRIFDFYPDSETLLQWDARWYANIKDNGYYFDANDKSSVAFFPMLPIIWYLTQLDPVGMSIINTVLFLVGFCLIGKHLNLSFRQATLFITLPGFYFYIVPYSEALFFLASALLLIGLDKKNNYLITTGLVIASLTRSIGMLFAFALAFTFLIQYLRNRQKRAIISLGIYILLLVALTIAVFYIHYIYTGEWGVFFKAQKMWNRELRWPVFPLTTISGIRMLWMDGLALLVCMLAFITSSKTLYNHVFSKEKENVAMSEIFSMAFLAVTGVVSILFSGVWQKNEGTSLLSLNRFIFASPFLIFFLRYLLFSHPFKRNFKAVIPISMLITWLAIGAYKTLNGHTVYSQTLLYFFNMTMFVSLYIFLNKIKILNYIVAIIQLTIGIFLFYLFQNSYWVG